MNEEFTFTSEAALAYEKNTRISLPTYDALFSMVQSYFRAQLGEKEASLLVVGAGSGNELAAWGPSNPAWTFTGVDPSEDMLKTAEDKTMQLELENRVRLIQGTIDDVPLQNPPFDAASCILVLHFIHDEQEKQNLLTSIKNRLKPGAPFVLVSANGDLDSAELHNRLNVWKSFWLDAGHDTAHLDEMIGKLKKQVSFLTDTQIEQFLTAAGFTNISRFYSTGIMAGWMCHAK
ncbi:tRNA (cmo5U34)-methyltransferase [Salibacterium salarium]|uniref:class I SAM-dependent methyltransferase n=1 Tax=Salibacterium salarium TaxID=284579 RepID=UPI00278714B5|nr:class I SAM-dependent methyltransferase [Salibacterium salarium]MDQ0300506.1 tRNA (cmo5U34)-methyltransferase [Salibacterium salarium]